MKMKHIIHKLYRPAALALCLCAALTFASCDDFLDMQPTNSGNAEEAVRTVRDAQVVLNGVMSAMTSYAYYGRNMFMYADAKGGDLTIYMAGRGLDDLYTFNHTPTTGTYSGFWSQIYYCILQVNTLLDNIDRLEAEGSEEDFTFARGQALTLRALFYFDLVRLYGLPYTYDKASPGVPNITRPLDVSAQPTRATVEENYRQIVADLEEAEPLLATDKSPQDGYVGYYANLALQARVKLYMADYDGALAAARTVIDDGAYTPYEPGEWVDSWSHQYGSESILELAILNDDISVNEGAIAENIVCQMLRCNDLPTFYFDLSKPDVPRMEVDFITMLGSSIAAIEVESGKKRRTPSIANLKKDVRGKDVGRFIKLYNGDITTPAHDPEFEHYPMFCIAFADAMIPEDEGLELPEAPIIRI